MNRLCVWAKGAKNREEVAYGRDIGKVEVARPLFPPPPPEPIFSFFSTQKPVPRLPQMFILPSFESRFLTTASQLKSSKTSL